ncbi:DUF3489 domain-containing protein [Chenggangzhangella methanolivorans]|uniref:DUF3489 domain-containing protein n=1 Tax=Chenggangzhangella methanolivorans TaxID=1437009 RepID=A0A9E6RHQ4_9HYPH|nr:DUF3489 domain-containing protein [Chenggangzhangella methanolivorans]QZO01237.1 DUF3489 domain-containing protein [Chenggangzhangella methanolivorans]
MPHTTSAEPKLTDAQLVLLSAASQREDGLIVLTDAHPSVARTIAALLRKELLIELVVQRRQPHWRQDENGKPIGLKLTKIGYLAIGAEGGVDATTEPARAAPEIDTIRAGTKQAIIVNLLARPEGATLGDLIDATGWLPHTTRAVLSGLRKRGFVLSSEKPEQGECRYSIAASAQASAV